MEEIELTEVEALDALRQAMRVPIDVWEHDANTWTARELSEMLSLSDQAARDRANEAVEDGRMVKGKVRGTRGRYLDAWRLVSD